MEWDPEYLAAIEREQCRLIHEAIEQHATGGYRRPPEKYHETIDMLKRAIAAITANPVVIESPDFAKQLAEIEKKYGAQVV